MILNQRNWYYKKHCRYEFGSYVEESQVNKPTNMNLSRTASVIELSRTTNIKEGHKLMDLDTGK